MSETWEETKKVYLTSKDMYDEIAGCGCCSTDYDNTFEDLRAMIIKEYLDGIY